MPSLPGLPSLCTLAPTNSAPAALTPGDWYLAVINRDTNQVQFTVRVIEFIEGTNLMRLTSGVDYPVFVDLTNGLRDPGSLSGTLTRPDATTSLPCPSRVT